MSERSYYHYGCLSKCWVSYFEWLKNISKVRYGRLEKRFSENLNAEIIRAIERLSEKNIS
ncbi:MAG: hypothetical protein ACFIN4_00125 [Candidatus Walczuchella monophlebidarum]